MLPPAVRSAWGLTPPASRGPRAELTLTGIVDAAIRIADAEGLSALSMARVAAELGFSTMALYRHVHAKEELLLHMQDAALGAPRMELTRDCGWREGLSIWTRSLLKRYSEHVWATDTPVSTSPLMPRNLEWMDWACSVMADLPIHPGEKLSTLLLLGGYARNEARLNSSLNLEAGAAGEEIDYEHAWRVLADVDRFPSFHALLEEGGLFDALPETGPTESEDDSFVYGLERILDGVDALVRRRVSSQ